MWQFIVAIPVGIVAAIHVYIVILEMFLWQRPAGRAAFGLDEETARITAPLAANQGLYNGFLVAGLVWGIIAGNLAIMAFFLCCVLVAGVYGAVTASRKILYVQALPGAVALAVLVLV